MREFIRPADAVAALGGLASRAELLALGLDADHIDLSRRYTRVLRVRRGWYASVDTPRVILRALRAGGRLACVSAIAWHEEREIREPLHVLVPQGSSRLRAEGTIVHWSRREVRGTRLVVDEEVPRAQAARCRASRSG